MTSFRPPSPRAPKAKSMPQEEADAKVREFLARGGEVQQCTPLVVWREVKKDMSAGRRRGVWMRASAAQTAIKAMQQADQSEGGSGDVQGET